MPDYRELRCGTVIVGFIALTLLGTFQSPAQTNAAPDKPNRPVPTGVQTQTNDVLALMRLSEQIRGECINGRRQICGRVLQVLPDGLVVESGYTNLLREPLTKSWLVPGTVSVVHSTNLLESTEPGAICVGRIFLADLPKSRGAKPARYDYIIIEGYPAGERTYTSIGTITRTVRRYSANLNKAVDYRMKAVMNTNSPAPPAK